MRKREEKITRDYVQEKRRVEGERDWQGRRRKKILRGKHDKEGQKKETRK